MIHLVEGDILLSKSQFTAHGVAPNDDFKSGLALALRERWPAMYKDFRHHCHQSHPAAGSIWTWSGPGGVRIVNLMTQEGAYDHGSRPGKATVATVNHCLRELAKLCVEEQAESVALSRVATGVGGLEWEEVEPLVRTHLEPLGTDVFVYAKYVAGEQADEKPGKRRS